MVGLMIKFFQWDKNSFQSKLKQSTILNESENINVNDIKSMLRGFKETSENPSTEGLLARLKEFLQCIPAKPTPKVQLKILVACHILVVDNKISKTFSTLFMSWDGFRTDVKDQLVQLYGMYLQKLCHENPIITLTKNKKFPKLNEILREQITYYKVINLLNFIFSNFMFYGTLTATPSPITQIYYEIYLLIWNDTIALYFYLENMILQFLDLHHLLNYQEFSILYEMLSDFQRLSTEIVSFFAINKTFEHEYQLKEPKWNTISRSTIEEVHNFNITLRITQPSIRPKFKCHTQRVSPLQSTRRSPLKDFSPLRTTLDILRSTGTQHNITEEVRRKR